jgi:hypothetical protein
MNTEDEEADEVEVGGPSCIFRFRDLVMGPILVMETPP